MNDANRMLIVFFASAAIVAMAVLIFVTWTAPQETIDRVGDLAEFLADNNTDAGKAIVTLAALAVGIVALLFIIIELAPEDEIKELRIEQAGATTIVPAEALRMRLNEALLMLPGVTGGRTKVWSRDKGIAASADLVVTPQTNIAYVTQEAARVVVDTVQTDLGLPVVGVPSVRIAFGPARQDGARPQPGTPVSSPAPMETVQTVDERVTAAPEPAAAQADSSPGPLIYDETPPDTRSEERPDQPQP